MTLKQVLEWRPNRSQGDRNDILNSISYVGAVSFCIPPVGGYIRGVSSDGCVLMAAHPGYLYFPRGHRPPGLADNRWHTVPLSTFNARRDSDRPGQSTKFCPVHGYPLRPAGGRDGCD